jgi:hypothetical protein
MTTANRCETMGPWAVSIRLGPWWSVPTREVRTRTLRRCATALKKTQKFRALTARWKRDTATTGHLSKIVMHPDYQRIMAMGPEVIPLILQDLSKSSGHWFWALHNLVPPGHDPAEGTTTIKDATHAWLEWGKAKGLL